MEDSVKGLLEAEEKAALIVEQANSNRYFPYQLQN